MKKIYKSLYYVSTDKKQWRRYYTNDVMFHYLDIPENEILYQEFKYEDINFEHFEERITLFGKRYKYIDSWYVEDYFSIKPEETLYLKKCYKEVENIFSIKELMNNLNADDFIEYLKDRGINSCPITNI